jgi:hypothetical protein
MASVPLVAGFLLYALALPATGFRRLIFGLFIPILSLPMMFASTGFPLYLALYNDLPPVFDYAAVVALLVLIWAAVVGTVHLTEMWRNGGGLVFQPVKTGQSVEPNPVMEDVS